MFQILKSEKRKNNKTIANNEIHALIFKCNWLRAIFSNIYSNDWFFREGGGYCLMYKNVKF